MSNTAKLFLYLLVILVIGTGVLWFVGGKKHEYSTKVTIGAEPSRVYRYLSDPDLLNEWSDEVLEIEPFESQRSDLDAVAEVLIDQSGQQVAMRQQVIKFEEDKMISLQRTNDFLKTTSIFRLEDNSSKTELTYRVKESRLGLSRVLGFFSGSNRQEVIKREILQLKQLVENNLGKDLNELPRFPLIDEPKVPLVPPAELSTVGEGEDVNQPIEELTPSSEPAPTGQQNRPDQAFNDN